MVNYNLVVFSIFKCQPNNVGPYMKAFDRSALSSLDVFHYFLYSAFSEIFHFGTNCLFCFTHHEKQLQVSMKPAQLTYTWNGILEYCELFYSFKMTL